MVLVVRHDGFGQALHLGELFATSLVQSCNIGDDTIGAAAALPFGATAEHQNLRRRLLQGCEEWIRKSLRLDAKAELARHQLSRFVVLLVCD